MVDFSSGSVCRVALATLLALSAVACGDDGGPADSGSVDSGPVDSGEASDGGTGDSSTGDSGGADGGQDAATDAAADGATDASVTDGGADASADAAADGGGGVDAATGGCTRSADCARSEYCKTVDGMCGAAGTCDPIGGPICPRVLDPVCGCDGVTYNNPCLATVAGMSIDTVGACPAVPVCGIRPRGGCCFEDDQCSSSVGRVARCEGAVCTAGSEGVCVETPAAGRCWGDTDCTRGRTCVGASLCPCGAMCFAPDSPGTCR